MQTPDLARLSVSPAIGEDGVRAGERVVAKTIVRFHAVRMPKAIVRKARMHAADRDSGGHGTAATKQHATAGFGAQCAAQERAGEMSRDALRHRAVV
jgi:hypothetical protein